MGLILNIIGYEEKIVYLFTTYKKMAKQSTQNVSNYSYNVISNRENLDERKKKLIDNVKLDLFESLNIEGKLVNRNQLWKTLEILRANNWIWYPTGEVELRSGMRVEIKDDTYKDILDQYKELINERPDGFESELRKLDTKLAERLILDAWGFIEFKEWDKFLDDKTAKEESQIAYEWLNDLDDYKDKLELASKKLDNEDFFIIKWNDKYLAKLKGAEIAINHILSQEYIDDTKQKQQEEMVKDLQEQNKNLEAQINQKDQEIDELKKQLNDFDSNEKLKEESKEKNKENIEQIDTSLFINRDNLAKAISDSRVGSGFPTWSIEIKSWEYIDLESQDFFEEFKLKYIEAWNNKMRLKDLDTELAERIILSNPKWSDVSKRYQIQINNDEFGQNNKTEEELEKESLRCRDSLQGLGYNVEYITFEENFSDKEKIESKERELLEMQDEEARQKRIILELESELNSKRLHYTEAWRISKQEELKRMKDKLSKLQNDIRLLEDDILKLKRKTKKYHIIKMKSQTIAPPPPIPGPTPIIPDTYEDIATVSNITESYREEASRKAEEKLRWRYKKTAWYKPWTRPDKLNLFLRRQHIKEKYERQFMTNLRWVQWDFESSAAADRHEIERQEDFNEAIEVALTDIDENNYPNTRKELDRLILRATWTHPDWIKDPGLDRASFQSELKTILESNLDPNRPTTATDPNRRPLSDIYRMNDMDIIWTNIWEKVDNFRDHQILVRNIRDLVVIHRNDATDDPFVNNCRPLISAHISKHRVAPEFLKVNNIKLDDSNSMRQLKILESNNQILTNIAARTLKLKIQLLTKGQEAYNVEQKWKWAVKAGEWLDRPYKEDSKLWRYFKKHPAMKEAFSWLRWWTKIAAVTVPAMFLAPIWPLAVASYVWTATFAQVFFKKHAHYNKEHRWYQTRQATNLAMNTQERQRLNNVVWWMSRFRRNALYYFWLGKTARDVRQFRDYVQTTQNKLEDTNQVNASIENLINKNVLSNPEIINLEDRLAEWLARLDFHRETVRWWVSGQNFLGSNTQATSESEYQKLHRNILAGASRLWVSLDDIRNYVRYNSVKTQIKEGTGQKKWTEEIGYDIAVDRKKSRQREKAVRWALKAGWISFGISYLASALFSGKETKVITEDTIDSKSLSAQWNWNPAIHNESAFVVWDVDVPLQSTLSSNPSWSITGMDVHIRAWVDKLSYMDVWKATSEMLAKQTNLQAYITSNFTWDNQIKLLDAINNANLWTVQSFAASNWADAWNQLLFATRYIEWVKETAEAMVNTWHTTTPLWSISFDSAGSVVEQSAGWSGGNLAARNMWVTMDYVVKSTQDRLVEETVNRWIWIPVPMNTFGEKLPRDWVNEDKKVK
jgi:hypothetical protein